MKGLNIYTQYLNNMNKCIEHYVIPNVNANTPLRDIVAVIQDVDDLSYVDTRLKDSEEDKLFFKNNDFLYESLAVHLRSIIDKNNYDATKTENLLASCGDLLADDADLDTLLDNVALKGFDTDVTYPSAMFADMQTTRDRTQSALHPNIEADKTKNKSMDAMHNGDTSMDGQKHTTLFDYMVKSIQNVPALPTGLMYKEAPNSATSWGRDAHLLPINTPLNMLSVLPVLPAQTAKAPTLFEEEIAKSIMGTYDILASVPKGVRKVADKLKETDKGLDANLDDNVEEDTKIKRVKPTTK